MSGQIQTLATPPPVSVQTLLYNIYLAAGGSGGGGGGGSTAWTDITDKPSSFTPSAHASLHGSAGSDPLTLAQSQVSNLTTDLAAKASTSALTSHTSNISNPHSVTKAQVGLDNCDNTSDADKPISTATQTALDGKASTSHTHSDATTSAAGFMSAADKLKLDGVEAAADVTDAGNVGSAIHGATGKTTPVDADTLPLIDSAASNVLKKLTWANLKATLKAYFDGFYMLKAIYDPQNAGRISGADGADEELYGGASGGTGGTLSMDGGNASTFMETAFAAGSAGSINTSGGNADGGQFGGSGGSINTSGGPGISGGSINTTAGGGITTGSGDINLGNTSGTLDPHALSPLPAIAVRIPIFFSDQSTDWTTGLKVTFTWRFGATTLSSTPIDCVTAPTGSAAQFDVKKNGTTIYSTKPTIDASETTTDTGATPAVISTTSLANGDIVTIHIDQVGSSNKGQGGVITFVGTTIP